MLIYPQTTKIIEWISGGSHQGLSNTEKGMSTKSQTILEHVICLDILNPGTDVPTLVSWISTNKQRSDLYKGNT